MSSPTPPSAPLLGEDTKSDAPLSPTGRWKSWLFFHAFVLLFFISLWTWKLLEPHPVPEDLRAELDWAGLSFIAAKSLHAVGYAFLTVLAATLPVPQRWRYVLIGLLVLHGVATEIGQYVMDVGRTGQVKDVLIDWVGITAGVGLVWAWSTRTRPHGSRPPPTQPSNPPTE